MSNKPAIRIRELELMHAEANLDRAVLLIEDQLTADIKRVVENLRDLIENSAKLTRKPKGKK